MGCSGRHNLIHKNQINKNNQSPLRRRRQAQTQTHRHTTTTPILYRNTPHSFLFGECGGLASIIALLVLLLLHFDDDHLFIETLIIRSSSGNMAGWLLSLLYPVLSCSFLLRSHLPGLFLKPRVFARHRFLTGNPSKSMKPRVSAKLRFS